jgi:hypothetical protein
MQFMSRMVGWCACTSKHSLLVLNVQVKSVLTQTCRATMESMNVMICSIIGAKFERVMD